MGVRDKEIAILVKIILHMIASIGLIVWSVKKDRKTRYHKLLIYLSAVSSVFCIVTSRSSTFSDGALRSLRQRRLSPAAHRSVEVSLTLLTSSYALKATIPSAFTLFALEMYTESLFIQQKYSVVNALRHINKMVTGFAICKLGGNRFDPCELMDVFS